MGLIKSKGFIEIVHLMLCTVQQTEKADPVRQVIHGVAMVELIHTRLREPRPLRHQQQMLRDEGISIQQNLGALIQRRLGVFQAFIFAVQ